MGSIDLMIYKLTQIKCWLFLPPTPLAVRFAFTVLRRFEQNGGRGRIRTDERTKRADLQSASFSHLDTLPFRKHAIIKSQKLEASRLS